MYVFCRRPGELVGIFPEDAGTAKIEMLGGVFTVIGIMDSEEFNNTKIWTTRS